MMGDIYALQLSFSPLNFKYSSDLILMKWKLKHLAAVNEFLDYFNTEWLNNNSDWYEGIAHKTPSL